MAAKGTLTVRVLGDSKPFQKAIGNVGGAARKFAKVGATAFAAVGAAAVGGAFKVADIGDEVAKSAGKAGLAVEPFQELRFAFGQGGVEAATMDTALLKFNKRLGESATGTGTASEAFETLGVKLTDASGGVRDTTETLDEVLPKLAGIESDAERAALAGDLFGQRAGPELAAALSDGIGGIDEARQKAQELGIVMGGEAAEAAEKFTDQWDDITQSAMGLVREGLTPVMTAMSEKVFPYILDTAIPAVRDLWDVFQDGEGLIGGISNVFSDLFSSGGNMFQGLIEAAQNAFQQLVDWLVDGGLTMIFDSLLAARERLFEAAMQLFPAILTAAIEFLPQLLAWFTETFIPQLLEFLVAQIPALLEAGLTLFRTLIEAVVQFLPDLIATLANDVLPAILQAITEMLPELLTAGIELFMMLVEAVIEVLPDLLSTLLGDVLPQVLQTVLEMLPDLLHAAVELFLMLVQAVVEVLPELIGILIGEVLPNVISTIIDMTPELLAAAVEAFFALVEAIPQIVPELVGAIFTDILPALLGALSDIIPSLLGAGRDIVRGIWDGISSMGGFLARKVGGFVSRAIPGPIKSMLGIGSPSKVAADLAREVPAGMVIGLDSQARKLQAASERAAMAALPELGVPTVGPYTVATSPSGSRASNETNRLLRELLTEMRRGGDVYLDGDRVGQTLVNSVRATQGGWR